GAPIGAPVAVARDRQREARLAEEARVLLDARAQLAGLDVPHVDAPVDAGGDEPVAGGTEGDRLRHGGVAAHDARDALRGDVPEKDVALPAEPGDRDGAAVG